MNHYNGAAVGVTLWSHGGLKSMETTRKQMAIVIQGALPCSWHGAGIIQDNKFPISFLTQSCKTTHLKVQRLHFMHKEDNGSESWQFVMCVNISGPILRAKAEVHKTLANSDCCPNQYIKFYNYRQYVTMFHIIVSHKCLYARLCMFTNRRYLLTQVFPSNQNTDTNWQNTAVCSSHTSATILLMHVLLKANLGTQH